MGNFLKKVTVLFLGFLVVFSSIGFSVSSHLCGGSVVLTSVDIIKKNLTCGMKKDKNKCPNKSHIRKICCQNTFQYFHILEGLDKQVALELNKTVALLPFPNEIEINITTLNNPVFEHYIPPIWIADLVVEHQCYLI